MFKRIITLLTIIAVLCSVMSAAIISSASYEADVVYGDVDGDGKLTTEDARLALRIASGILDFDAACLKRSDINFDEKITIFDARQILRGAVGLTSLQPTGSFGGFDGGSVFKNEEALVAYFNAYLNRIKVTENETTQYIAATITKTENEKLTRFGIKEVELPGFGYGTTAEGVVSMIEEELTADDEEDVVTVIPYGSTDLSVIPVEGEAYVAQLTAADVFGSRAMYDAGLGQLTIEIALPDTEVETLDKSAYAKVYNATMLIEEQNSTIMKLLKNGSAGAAMFRQLKNGVLKIVVDTTTNNVLSYEMSYESHAYISQAEFGIGVLLNAKLKEIELQKNHNVKFDNFQWPNK